MQFPNWNHMIFMSDNSTNVKILQLSFKKMSPVFHQPVVLSSFCAVAHNQDRVIHHYWVAAGNII